MLPTITQLTGILLGLLYWFMPRLIMLALLYLVIRKAVRDALRTSQDQTERD